MDVTLWCYDCTDEWDEWGEVQKTVLRRNQKTEIKTENRNRKTEIGKRK